MLCGLSPNLTWAVTPWIIRNASSGKRNAFFIRQDIFTNAGNAPAEEGKIYG
jgi:hypothetical protein